MAALLTCGFSRCVADEDYDSLYSRSGDDEISLTFHKQTSSRGEKRGSKKLTHHDHESEYREPSEYDERRPHQPYRHRHQHREHERVRFAHDRRPPLGHSDRSVSIHGDYTSIASASVSASANPTELQAPPELIGTFLHSLSAKRMSESRRRVDIVDDGGRQSHLFKTMVERMHQEQRRHRREHQHLQKQYADRYEKGLVTSEDELISAVTMDLPSIRQPESSWIEKMREKEVKPATFASGIPQEIFIATEIDDRDTYEGVSTMGGDTRITNTFSTNERDREPYEDDHIADECAHIAKTFPNNAREQHCANEHFAVREKLVETSVSLQSMDQDNEVEKEDKYELFGENIVDYSTPNFEGQQETEKHSYDEREVVETPIDRTLCPQNEVVGIKEEEKQSEKPVVKNNNDAIVCNKVKGRRAQLPVAAAAQCKHIRLRVRKPLGILFEPMAAGGVRTSELSGSIKCRKLELLDELVSINGKNMKRKKFDGVMAAFAEIDPSEKMELIFKRKTMSN